MNACAVIAQPLGAVGKGREMPETKIIDCGFLMWGLGALISVILFLLGFGIKEARENLARIPEMIAKIESLLVMAEQLEKRIERLERRRDRDEG